MGLCMSNIFPIVSGAMAHNSTSQPAFESSLGDGGSKLVKFAQKFTDPDTSAQKSLEIAKIASIRTPLRLWGTYVATFGNVCRIVQDQ